MPVRPVQRKQIFFKLSGHAVLILKTSKLSQQTGQFLDLTITVQEAEADTLKTVKEKNQHPGGKQWQEWRFQEWSLEAKDWR